MSRLASIHRELSETTALMKRYELAVLDDPEANAYLEHDIRSLEKLRNQLELEFSLIAEDLQVDECRYRIFRDGDTPPLWPVTSILGEFQYLVALVFHSIDQKSALTRGNLDAATIANTSFRIGYSFEGSVGFVLTLPNESLTLFPEMTTKIDESIDVVFQLASLRTHDDIRSITTRYGRPIVKSCYRWAGLHASNQINSDVEWKRGRSVRSKLFVQHQEFAHLISIIDQASEDEDREFYVDGVLTGANVTTKSFHFAINGADQVHGSFDDAISDNHAATVPARYKALIRETRSINYATDERKLRYHLLRLDSV